MSSNWALDINSMHNTYGVHAAVDKMGSGKLKQFLEFRLNFLQEELDETRNAAETMDGEEIVDGLIDLCVVAIGTLDLFEVDAHKAWDEVLKANMSKKVGVKESRPNPLGLPDLVKPEGWVGPDHTGNTGKF